MIDVQKLKGKIVEKGLNVERLAKMIGVNKSTLYRKLNGTADDITIGEALSIARVLELNRDEATTIFFGADVA